MFTVYSLRFTDDYIRGEKNMKAMYKSELARLAGVSSRTFARYLATHREELAKLGVTPYTRKLRGSAVQFIVEDYCIDLPPDV